MMKAFYGWVSATYITQVGVVRPLLNDRHVVSPMIKRKEPAVAIGSLPGTFPDPAGLAR
jgi:hypothetical protein